VFLRFPWQWQAFWNFKASKPFIHMPYNISIKFHPISSTLNFSHFLWQRRPFWNFQASKLCVHMSDKIYGKFHPIPSTLNFCGFHGNGGHFENSGSSLHIYS
jgi:hypothetical protein